MIFIIFTISVYIRLGKFTSLLHLLHPKVGVFSFETRNHPLLKLKYNFVSVNWIETSNDSIAVDTWDKPDQYSPIIRSLDKNPVKVFIRACNEVRRLLI